MFQSIIGYSIRNKLIILLFTAAIGIAGVFAMLGIPLDAVPDITNNQVQVVTTSPSLAAEEVEQLLTFPIEMALSNLPEVQEIRSISRYGLSVITVVFSPSIPTLDARQYVREQLATIDLPTGLGTPELMPITTGLGEIYQYVLQVEPGYEDDYSLMDLRTLQDWLVKRQLAGIPGVIEVSSFGGLVKQYEVSLNPERLFALNLSVADVLNAVETNNANSGGSYLQQSHRSIYIRTFGRVENLEEIGSIMVSPNNGVPILLRDVAEIRLGSPQRYGAMTMDGQGEVVGGITLMLKGSSSSATIAAVQERVEKVQQALPKGIILYPYLDRSDLIGRAIHTVQNNLLEGGLIVIFVLVLLLGNWRGGVIVASVIPLSMLFAFILMRLTGVSANLMSLGAIDFGIVVDGAVIIVEGVLHVLYTTHVGKQLRQQEMDHTIAQTAGQIYKTAAFGILIILIVFVPIMTLSGIEGRTFRPMAFTVSYAILGAMLLSLTYVPVMASLLLKKDIRAHHTFADKIMTRLRQWYEPSLKMALRFPVAVLSGAMMMLLMAVLVFSRMGGEFIPTLEEGDLAMQMTIQPGSSLDESIRTTSQAEKLLLAHFPEVIHVVSKIGTAEVPTDPMAIENADIMIILKPKEEWTSAEHREDLVAAMKAKLSVLLGATVEFTQPIQLRFNELMTGAKTDIAIQIFGEDTETLARLAHQTEALVMPIRGAGDVKVEQTEGLPQWLIEYDRSMIAFYGTSIQELNTLVQTAYAGTTVGQVFENERRFDLAVRNRDQDRTKLNLDELWFRAATGHLIPMSKVAQATYRESPLQISREQAKRRISVGVNVRDRDVESLVAEIRQTLNENLHLPTGYTIAYGGQFENLVQARARLAVAIPLALVSIVILLYFAFHQIKDALMIFIAVPFSAIGGVFALWLRDMPFSISAGVGFIALFGVAVLNGIVLIGHYQHLEEQGEKDFYQLVIHGALSRLRPVIMTAAVASLGFLPMALSTSAGAEVQQPLATVVIGGLVSSTLLTLIVLPVLYHLAHVRWIRPTLLLIIIGGLSLNASAQSTGTTLQQVLEEAQRHPSLQLAQLQTAQSRALKKESYDPGQLNADLAYGQINAGRNDYHFSINQSLGNIPQSIAASRAGTLAVQWAQKNEILSQKWVEWSVTSTYLDWLLAHQIYESFVRQRAVFSSQLEKAQEALAAGEIAQLNVNVLIQENETLRRQLLEAKVQLEATTAQLAQWTNLPRESLTPPTAFPSLEYSGDTSLSAVFLEELEGRVAVQHQRVVSEKWGYFPELRVGYFNQELEGVTGFQGVQAGLSIPVWTRAQHARVQQTQVAEAIVSHETNLRRRALEQGLAQSLQVMQEIQLEGATSFHSYNDALQALENALQGGQLSYFDYARGINQTWEAHRSILQTQYLLLKTFNDLNYFTR